LYSQSLKVWRIVIDKRFIRTNDRIRAREIRVIGDEGEQIGVMPPFEALKLARSKNLDLVEISPTAQPPVCRIMDYGKYLYQQEKKEREAKKHQKTITVKEVKFRINVDDHDYETKKNHVLRFLDGGDKVKATIFFRGREMTRTGLGRTILERLIKDAGRQHAARDSGAEEIGGGAREGKRERSQAKSESRAPGEDAAGKNGAGEVGAGEQRRTRSGSGGGRGRRSESRVVIITVVDPGWRNRLVERLHRRYFAARRTNSHSRIQKQS
jgi:translation initiation factor IF-3